MLKLLMQRAGQLRQRLTRLDEQPLSKAALIVLIFLDLFILSSIFDGLAVHTRQMPGPEQRIPAMCHELVLGGNWNAANRVEKLAGHVRTDRARMHVRGAEDGVEEMNAHCRSVVSAWRSIRDDADLGARFGRYQETLVEIGALRSDLERTKGAYDTRLLERIADADKAARDAPDAPNAIAKRIAEKTAALNEATQRQNDLEAALVAHPKVVALFGALARISDADKDALREELRSLNFWYPVKRLGMEMLFLGPLLLVFFAWNSRSLTHGRRFQTLVSSHLLVVASIPVLFEALRLVYDILPHHVIQQLIELLAQYRLVALWHYLIMGAAILAALGLIYLFQKKLFSHERLMLRRITKGQCQSCGTPLPAGSVYCVACGAGQTHPCKHCGRQTFVHGKHCMACGGENRQITSE